MANTQQYPQSALKMQDAATTGNGKVLMLRSLQEDVNIWLESSGTTSGGTISIEEGFWPDDQPAFAGTWSVIALINASDITGGQGLMVHKPGNFWAVRVRTATPITGGGSYSAWGWGS